MTLPDDHVVSYNRDALSRVTAKRVDGVIVKGWIYKDALKPIAETDAAGNVVSFFVYGTSGLSPDTMDKDGVTYRFIRDVQGSVRLVVDAATGAIAQRLDYDSFGNVLLDTAPGFQPFGFQSGLYDPDTALVQFGARWYDANTGRWLSKDPILLEGGLNLYVFCGNDPVNFADPLGLCEEEDSGIGFWDGVQGLLDAGGVFEPTPFCDLTSAFISACRGRNDDALISLAGVIPYFGDLGKIGKYGGKALKYADEGAAAAKQVGRYSDDAAELVDLAKQAKRTGVSPADAETLLKWADEYKVRPALDHINTDHWVGGPHVRVGPVNHIPVKP